MRSQTSTDLDTVAKMRKIWDRYRSETATPSRSEAYIVARMMLDASRIMHAPGGPFPVDLVGVALAASQLLPGRDVLAPALEEYYRAAEKHPGMTLECDGHTDATRLFALVEEIGEVAACLTYDNDAETGHGSDLESEVIQVVALALAWATRYLEEGN